LALGTAARFEIRRQLPRQTAIGRMTAPSSGKTSLTTPSTRAQAVDLLKYLATVIKDTGASADVYTRNFAAGTPMHAAPFFGCADSALYATVGLNPSPAEFQDGRWPASALPLSEHLGRLLNYFENPKVPYYDSWFGCWERALGHLGRSYFRDTIHLDLSPRATIPLRSCPDKRLFVKMVAADINSFFAFLEHVPQIRGLLVAWSGCGITLNDKVGAMYLDRIIRESGEKLGFKLVALDVLQRSGPKIALYRLSRPKGDTLPVFFCGASPSSNSREDLGKAVQQRAALLKRTGF
jgi:hypothetical protein